MTSSLLQPLPIDRFYQPALRFPVVIKYTYDRKVVIDAEGNTTDLTDLSPNHFNQFCRSLSRSYAGRSSS